MLLQIAKKHSKNGAFYRAEELYEYSSNGEPSTCKIGCKMNTANNSNYSSRKEFLF